MNQLQNNWPIVPLRSVIGKTGLFTDGDWILSKNMSSNGTIRLLQLADVGVGEFLNKSSKFITDKKCAELNCTKILTGDILISRMSEPIARACIIPELNQEAIAAVDLSIVRVDPKVADSRFVVLLCNNQIVHDQAERLGRGTTRKRITRKHLEKIQIPLPTLLVQRKIASIIEKTESAREKRKEANRLTDEFLESAFIEMFGDPIKNPMGWEIKRFDEIYDSIRYATSSPPKYISDGVSFIRATNIKNGTVVTNDIKYISAKDANQLKKCRLSQGNLIIVRSGVNAGDSAVIPGQFNGACAGYDLIVELLFNRAIFYSHLINSIFGRTMIAPLKRRAGQPHLNTEQVGSLKFISPPDFEQQKFAELVQKVEKLKENQRESEKELNNLFNSLMQRAFRGEIV